MFSIEKLVENKDFRKWVLKEQNLKNTYWENIYNNANVSDKKILNKAIENVEFIYSYDINKNIQIESDKNIKNSLEKLFALNKEASRSKLFRMTDALKYASVIIVFLSIGLLSHNYLFKSSNIFENHLKVASYNSNKVVIETEKGDFYEVPDRPTSWKSDYGVTINIDKNNLKFSDIKNDYKEKFIIHVPEKNKYRLSMLDGTTVDINSKSIFEFSLDNSSQKRITKLNGEAFFNVAKNKKRPFRVLSNDMEIEVLGTEFNVVSSKKEVFLIEGSVMVESKKNSIIIEPGEIAQILDNKISVSKSSINQSMLWNSNCMILENNKLTDILDLISKWYGKEIKYNTNEISEITFSGKIFKETGLDANLNKLRFAKDIDYKVFDEYIELKK